MTYKDKIAESREKAHTRHVATKILDLMRKLRLENTENSKRRWIWELIQNAMDVSFDNNSIKIRIEFDQKDSYSLKFSHNGKPFSVENITFLIEQVSTKDRGSSNSKDKKTIGKFGTGFLTTHLLSEKVQIESFLHEEGEPYRRIEINLDRSGREIEEISKSVDESFKNLEEAIWQDQNENFITSNYNTCFHYSLDESKIPIAQYGLDDLTINLSFVLVFANQIEEVHLAHEKLKYSLNPKPEKLIENILLHRVNITDELLFDTENLIVTISDNETVIAIEVEKNDRGQILVKKHNQKTPKLFCTFPLIGTELFPFPVIINNPYFNPTEPRDGVYLTDIDEPDIFQNKKILESSVNLYLELLKYASSNKWGSLYNLVHINNNLESELISNNWYENFIRNPIIEGLNTTPIITTSEGELLSVKNSKSKPQIYFPYHIDKDSRSSIWQFSHDLNPFNVPTEIDIDNWYEVIWKGCYKETYKTIIEDIKDLKELSTLSERLDYDDENKSIIWLEKFYKTLHKESNIKGEFFSLQIFPNQNGEFNSTNGLFGDNEIDEKLKKIAKLLGYDIKSELLDSRISFIKFPESRFRDNKYIASTIRDLIQSKLNEVDRSAETKQIFKEIYLWFNENNLLAKDIFGSLYKNKHRLYDDEIVIENMKKAEELDVLMEEYGIDNMNVLKEKLSTLKSNEIVSVPEEEFRHDSISENVLLIYGITSEQQLKEMLLDVKFSNRFIHINTPTQKMYDYAQNLIERAIKNVKEYLISLPNYGSDWEDIAPTIISGEKEEKSISIVVRPSDNGEVIFYYGSERDALEDGSSELWVEDGISAPLNLTLGKILKKTGITKIMLDGD
ncbi:ATP-binding protein [uncultured Dokdonia sp.]|uniref:ATP-binding protein n=1 Tax=uncultured Dokdonia sp. TaxID=575653 RepID=UPI002608056A|nr:ATP-binding protein [uncultured Dokdonia sp.]